MVYLKNTPQWKWIIEIASYTWNNLNNNVPVIRIVIGAKQDAMQNRLIFTFPVLDSLSTLSLFGIFHKLP